MSVFKVDGAFPFPCRQGCAPDLSVAASLSAFSFFPIAVYYSFVMFVACSPRAAAAARALRPLFSSAPGSVALGVIRPSQYIRCASSAAGAPGSNEALLSTSRATGEPRTPLSQEQKQFLDGAVRHFAAFRNSPV